MEQETKNKLDSPISLKAATWILLSFTAFMVALWGINHFEPVRLRWLQSSIELAYFLYFWPLILEFGNGKRIRWHILLWLFCYFVLNLTLSVTYTSTEVKSEPAHSANSASLRGR